VHVPQTLARGITIGQVAEVKIPELPNEKFEAKVVRTSGAMTVSSRTLLTELELPNKDGKILAGTFAQVRFPNAAASGTLTVPSNSVLFRAEGTQLAFVKGDEIELRNVTLGRDFGPKVEILAGATKEDSVVLNPPDSIITGMKVRVAR
jgi:multidrug efflux pump subunit AcrA (membrane-fusion protein)